jgi:hypothetical protein
MTFETKKARASPLGGTPGRWYSQTFPVCSDSRAVRGKFRCHDPVVTAVTDKTGPLMFVPVIDGVVVANLKKPTFIWPIESSWESNFPLELK